MAERAVHGPDGSEAGFIEHMDTVQEYLELQRSLEESLEAGFLSMARARYQTNATEISTIRIPSHISASTGVSRSDASGELQLVRSENFRPLTLPARSHGLGEAGCRAGSGQDKVPSSDNAARQMPASGSPPAPSIVDQIAERFACQRLEDAPKAQDADGAAGTAPKGADPLRWYGGLVPHDMRRAEKHFQSALQLMMRAATLRTKLAMTFETRWYEPSQ
ncbi:hypothetical protein ACKKBG_A05360 [Auxenochlorella protothecoides x Auxenochlorella symbiontica]